MASLCRCGVEVSCNECLFDVVLWSLVFARVGVALLFESLLGLVVGVCGCAVCLCLAVFSQFSPINWTLSS
jgi:hypothetical protein